MFKGTNVNAKIVIKLYYHQIQISPNKLFVSAWTKFLQNWTEGATFTKNQLFFNQFSGSFHQKYFVWKLQGLWLLEIP